MIIINIQSTWLFLFESGWIKINQNMPVFSHGWVIWSPNPLFLTFVLSALQAQHALLTSWNQSRVLKHVRWRMHVMTYTGSVVLRCGQRKRWPGCFLHWGATRDSRRASCGCWSPSQAAGSRPSVPPRESPRSWSARNNPQQVIKQSTIN